MILITQQVLTTLGWIVLALAISPMVWLIFQPYFKSLSPAERRANGLLHEVLTPEQCRQLVWRGYLEVPSPSTAQRVYRVRSEEHTSELQSHLNLVCRLL